MTISVAIGDTGEGQRRRCESAFLFLVLAVILDSCDEQKASSFVTVYLALAYYFTNKELGIIL